MGRVILWMAGALVSFCVMAVSVRALAQTLNIFEVLAIRSGSGLLILLAIVAARPELRRLVVPRRMWLHLLRNSIHYGAQYGWAVSVTLLPLATAFALEFTMPAWTTLLAVVILRERLTASRLGAIVLGFLGVLVILRPGFETFRPAALIMLMAAVGIALTLIATKKLTADVSAFAIVFWMNAMQLPMTMTGADPLFLAKLDAAQALPFLGLAVAGLSGHFCLAKAFRYGDAIIVVPLDFLRIPLIAVVGWVFYQERLDPFVFAGAGLIVTGILWNLRSEAR